METKAAAESGVVPAGSAPAQGLALLVEQLKALGPGRILAMGVVVLLLAGLLVAVAQRAVAPTYTLLFSGLELADSQQLVQRLEGMGVDYRLSAGGDAIMVPEGEALRLRMSLAEEGMPLGDTIGYEIFDRSSAFGASDFLANVNLRRAVEGELARTIGTLRHVRSARVHIVQPVRQPFQREAQKPTASIALSLGGGGALGRHQVDGIKHLVAAAVPGLVPDAVTLVDDAGQLLGPAGGAEGDDLGTEEERRVALEQRLKGRIVQLLERSIGAGKVDAEVNLDMDFDALATTAETYDPEGQVVRSTQTAEERAQQAENEPTDAVSVANNLPTERAEAQAGTRSNEQRDRTEETVNYEISRKVVNQTRRGGVIRRLSVAVQVDGTYAAAADGTQTFAPRSEAELAQLGALVRSAAGVDEARGDVVEIVSRPFLARPEPAQDAAETSLLTADDYRRAIELAVLVAVAALVLLFGVRPILRRMRPEPTSALVREETAVVMGADGNPLLVHGATGAAIGVDAEGRPVVIREPIVIERDSQPAESTVADAVPQLIKLKHVHGKVHAALVADVVQGVEERTEDAVRVLRAWLAEE